MLTVVEKVIVLQNVEIFEDILTEQLSYLAAIAEEASFSKDQEVMFDGFPANTPNLRGVVCHKPTAQRFGVNDLGMCANHADWTATISARIST